MNKKYKPLFEPMQIGKLKVKNKFFMAPMATLCEIDEDMAYMPSAVDYYVERAKGGVGMIVTGANYVENESEKHTRASFPCPTYFPTRWKRTAKEMTDRCKAFGTTMILQLTAGLGRSALPSNVAVKDFVAPSKITNRWMPNVECRELTTKEVEHIIAKFGEAAQIAKEVGFDGVEIHAVHEGYLLDCFTMALFNKRTDKFGGDLRSRLRFATDIVKTIKQKCGQDFPVILRFSIKSYIKAIRQGGLPGEDFKELGRDIDEAKEAIKILEEAGYDAFDADAGTYDSWYWAHPPMYFGKGVYLKLARAIKDTATKPVIVAGRMDDMEMAVRALNEGIIQGVGLGRPLLADPDFVNKVHNDQIQYIRPCLGCHDGCFGRLFGGGVGSCAVNPEVGREIFVGVKKAEEKKNVAVVGGGPAGLEAARVSALRGYQVTLFEKGNELGGALLVGGQPKFKEDDLQLARYYSNELRRLGVEIRLNTEASLDNLKELNPDIVYVAEGSTPAVPPIKGVENTVKAEAILTRKIKAERKVIVIGGGLVGCETALHLAQTDHDVAIVEALPDILKSGPMLPPMNEFMLRDLLAFNKVDIYGGAKVTEITDKGLTFEKDGKEVTLDADQVILAVGYRSTTKLYDSIKNEFPFVYSLGDEKQVRNIRAAIWDGYEVARNI